MSIRLRFPQNAAEHVNFAYSPVHEAALSLHVLAAPKHHALQAAWVRSCRELPSSVKREFRAFEFSFLSHTPGFLSTGAGLSGVDFEDAMAQIRRLPSAVAVKELFVPFLDDFHGSMDQPLHSPELRDHVLTVAAAQTDHALPVLRAAFEDPERVFERLLLFIEAYWAAAFADQWTAVEAKLHDDIASSARVLAQRGAGSMLAELLPEVIWDPVERIALLKRIHEHEIRIETRGGITFVPSVFTWPHVSVSCDEPWPISFVYPITSIRRPAIGIHGDRLLDILRALADDTRIRLLQLTAREPRSTQELAVLVSLSEASVSRHLRQMAAVGLVRARREGYYVLYSCEFELLRTLSEALLELPRRHDLDL